MDKLISPLALSLAIPLLLWVAFLWLKPRRQRERLMPFSGPDSLIQREIKRTRRTFRLLLAFTLISLGGLIFAIARPVVIHNKTLKTGEGIDMVIVLDVSESMDADDFAPSRIEVARRVVRDFIRRRNQDRIGIVVFSGDAVTKAPLTRDYDFLLSQVEAIQLREMKQGTAIGMGLANGITRLQKSTAKTKVIVLLTDGDSNVGAINPVTAASLARQEGIKIYTIGIGKSNRVVVPIYSYDIYGRRSQLIAQVPSYLNPELLRDIARRTNGKSYMARDAGMLSRFLQEIDSLERTKVQVTKTEERDEKFWIPAGLALLMMLVITLLEEIRFRRLRLKKRITYDVADQIPVAA